jgi:Ca-activated chloride channel homolog
MPFILSRRPHLARTGAYLLGLAFPLILSMLPVTIASAGDGSGGAQLQLRHAPSPFPPALAAEELFFLPAAGPSPLQDKPDRPPWAQKSKPDASETKPSGAASSSPDTDSQDSASQRGRIRVNVNLVNVLVSVLDEHNRPAIDLPRDSFHLFEEGVEQKIEVFEAETQQPLDIALVLNAAVSMRLEMSTERAAASGFIQKVLRPVDRVAVFSMDENVDQMTPFSNRAEELQDAVRRVTTTWGISLIDAVYLTSQALERQGSERRKVIVLLTDARDATSHVDFDKARREAVRSGSLLYTIVVRPVKNESGRNTAGEHAIQTITDTMGGAMFFPDSVRDLDGIFDRIDRELRTQYRLGYYPNPRGPANTYRSIEVKVSGNYQVRHRKSYLTGPQ